MVRVADAVVVARYTGRSQLVTSPGVDCTKFAFEIMEIVKGVLPTVVGDELQVQMIGGDREFSDHIRRTRVAETEPLRRGREDVMFLRFNPVKNDFGLAWASAGLYDVTAGKIRAVERGIPRHDGESTAVFLEALRNAAR